MSGMIILRSLCPWELLTKGSFCPYISFQTSKRWRHHTVYAVYWKTTNVVKEPGQYGARSVWKWNQSMHCMHYMCPWCDYRACDRLRCTGCDFKVCLFDNYKWHSDTNYLFLRNNVPDFAKLKSKLSPSKGKPIWSAWLLSCSSELRKCCATPA